MTNRKTNFALFLHNHQPIGNMPEIFDKVFSKAYLPFIEVLKRNPEIKITLHYSGILLEWLKEAHPDFLGTIKELLQEGQIELVTGGFYEPILPVIPEEDQIGQICKLSSYIEDTFGYHPRGIWLTERVWEPHLPKSLSQAGVEYTVLDDFHFIAAGMKEEELYGYFITEEQGFLLSVFPSHMKLRYLIPFSSPEETITHLKNLNKEGAEIIVVGDDGEKFGAWPETYQYVYEEGWLEEFFRLIAKNSGWIRTITLSECLDKNKPSGRVYLPTASYREMIEWSGGHWRNYLTKYPESNNLHKKMLYVSSKVHKDGSIEALNELWKGQCNDGYWHGIFGGLYLPHLRHALYSHLIKAEVLVDKRIKGDELWQKVEIFDFDKDGCGEVMVTTSKWNLYFDCQEGGALFELDYRPKALNLLNTLARRQEAYHQKIFEANNQQSEKRVKSIHELAKVKERGLEKYLVYDNYRRMCFIDHFFSSGVGLIDFMQNKYQELGNFTLGDYSVEVIGKEPIALYFKCLGKVLGESVLVEKSFIFDSKETQMDVDYQVTNLSKQTLSLNFGIEFNLFFLAGIKALLGSMNWDDKLQTVSEAVASELKIWDLANSICVGLKFSKEASFWIFPVETVSQSEEGFERIYQASTILPFWKLNLKPQESWQLRIKKMLKEES